ncbi:hypothetical protein ACIPMT_04110 [Streptomyces griseus]|uniref:hypothetical protein n=1 Tax=Streptomyces griseus TaxID=1911 RepID=UPI0038246929
MGGQLRFRFDGPGAYDPSVDACAVDENRVTLGCRTISSFQALGPADDSRTGDQWLDVENPEQVDAVLLIPDDQSSDRRTCAADGEDGGGTHPPEWPSRGDQL